MQRSPDRQSKSPSRYEITADHLNSVRHANGLLAKPAPKQKPNPFTLIDPSLEEVKVAVQALEPPPRPLPYIGWPMYQPKDETRLAYEHYYHESVRNWNIYQKAKNPNFVEVKYPEAIIYTKASHPSSSGPELKKRART